MDSIYGAANRSEIAQKFIRLALKYEAFQWGDFKLKSGRNSPYFLNFGKLCSGEAAAELGGMYAQLVKRLFRSLNLTPDVCTLFGMAYKGIPLAALTAAELSRNNLLHSMEVRYAYTRKESKDHGELGAMVGELKGAVVIIDDVLTAGTAAKQALQCVKKFAQSNANVCVVKGIVVGFERMEKAVGDNVAQTAMQKIQNDAQIESCSIADVRHLYDTLRQNGDPEHAQVLADHLKKHGSGPVLQTNNEISQHPRSSQNLQAPS